MAEPAREPSWIDPNREVRVWVRTKVKGKDYVNLPGLLDEAIEHFGARSGFMQRFFRCNARHIMDRAANEAMGRRYGGRGRGPGGIGLGPVSVDGGDGIMTRERFETGVADEMREGPFAEWFAHTAQGHVRLKVMGKKELKAARADRLANCRGQRIDAIFYAKLEARLPKGQKVGQHFTDDELTELHEESKAEARKEEERA